MVHQPTQSGEIEKPHKRNRIKEILFDTLVMIIVALATFAFLRLTIIKPENREVNNPSVMNKVPTGEEKPSEEPAVEDDNNQEAPSENDEEPVSEASL